ncbi:TPA: Fic family protein [Serratia marcescens]|uniref:Fic family protein n=1 Tax=Serratia marcescens TaxID=615 RepID=UPI0029684361|nr:Fic family protein [Serratia marcescens]HCR2985415.1 Fic family protein [Serratia marcescens]HCR2986707.1 Fic family protein [Serratia marcescens]HCR3010648.1 Fic family protein [Serratia marcescens]HCR3015378.1 Fic family protein [Serratia marcescens]
MGNYVLNGNVIKLQPFAYPDVSHLRKDSLVLLGKTQQLIKRTNIGYEQMVNNAIEAIKTDRVKLLQHRLSNHVDPKIFPSENATSRKEFSFYQHAEPVFIDKLLSDESFIGFISDAGRKIKDESNIIRQGNIRTVPDEEGGYTEFIDMSMLSVSLYSLRAYALKNDDTHCLFVSIVFSVMFVHAHPLLDGNGRASRLFFNMMLNNISSDYIPLTELCYAARSGYVLSLREAFLFSEWDNIIRFYCNCIHLLYGSSLSDLNSMQ